MFPKFHAVASRAGSEHLDRGRISAASRLALTGIFLLLLVGTSSTLAQEVASVPQNIQDLIDQQRLAPRPPDPLAPSVELIMAKGVPIRVILKKSIAVKTLGQPVYAYTIDPIYVFDRVTVPPGSEVDGHITELVSPSGLKKAAFYLNADFSAHRSVQVHFDTLVLPDRVRMPIRTNVIPDIGTVVKLETNPQNNGAADRARGLIRRQWHLAIAEVKPSALWQHAKGLLRSEWPYHKEKLAAGTVFVAELEQPLDFGPTILPAAEFGAMGQLPAAQSEAFARLTTPLDSATSRVGAPVDAVLTRPVFSADKKLLLPVGTELEGAVVRARPARRLHRNGQLHFKLTRVQLPSRSSQPIEMALEGMEVPKSSHIQLDSEGGTTVPGNTESRVLSTAFSAAIAVSTLDTDSGHPGATSSSENHPLGGVSGYKLIGLGLSFAARSPTLSQVLGFWGTGQSVYVHFIARGQDLVLPKNTPMQITFGERRSHAGGHAAD